MRRRKFLIFLTISAVFMAAVLSGCGSEPTLPSLDLYGSTLAGRAEYVSESENTCRVVVLRGDDHYDIRDEVQVSFTVISGADRIKVGSKVEFDYNYIDDVTEYNGLPHIAVDEIRVG